MTSTVEEMEQATQRILDRIARRLLDEREARKEKTEKLRDTNG